MSILLIGSHILNHEKGHSMRWINLILLFTLVLSGSGCTFVVKTGIPSTGGDVNSPYPPPEGTSTPEAYPPPGNTTTSTTTLSPTNTTTRTSTVLSPTTTMTVTKTRTPTRTATFAPTYTRTLEPSNTPSPTRTFIVGLPTVTTIPATSTLASTATTVPISFEKHQGADCPQTGRGEAYVSMFNSTDSPMVWDGYIKANDKVVGKKPDYEPPEPSGQWAYVGWSVPSDFSGSITGELIFYGADSTVLDRVTLEATLHCTP